MAGRHYRTPRAIGALAERRAPVFAMIAERAARWPLAVAPHRPMWTMVRVAYLALQRYWRIKFVLVNLR